MAVAKGDIGNQYRLAGSRLYGELAETRRGLRRCSRRTFFRRRSLVGSFGRHRVVL